MNGLFPVLVKRVKKCNRCGLKYPNENTSCNHCEYLNKNEVAILKAKFKQQQKKNAKLGKLFLLAMVVLFIFMTI